MKNYKENEITIKYTDRQHNEQDHEWNTTCQSWGELALWFLIIGQAIFVGLLFLFIGGE